MFEFGVVEFGFWFFCVVIFLWMVFLFELVLLVRLCGFV